MLSEKKEKWGGLSDSPYPASPVAQSFYGQLKKEEKKTAAAPHLERESRRQHRKEEASCIVLFLRTADREIQTTE